MADRKLPPDRESWDASEERLRSHIPNLEAFLQDIYTRSTGLSVEPTSAQFNTLSARVDANSGKASATVTSDHFSVLSQAISVLSQQVSALSQGVSVLSQQVSVLSQNLSALSSIGPNLRLSAGAGLGLSIHTEAGFDTIDVIGAGQDLYLRGNNVFLGNLANTANFSFQSAITGYRVRFPAADWFWAANDFQIGHTSAQLRLGPDADQVVLKKAGTSVLQISAQSVEITGNLNVSGTLSSPVLNTLSNQISVLSQAVSVLSQQVSVLSQQVSVLSQGISVVSVGVDRVSNAVSNETSNRISADNVLSNQISVLSQQVSILSQQISILSQQVSVHSQQISVLSQQVSILSNQVSVLSQQVSVISQQVSVISQGLSVVSVGVDRVSNAVSNETSNRISADNALSVKIDTVSNQVSVLSQQVSVLSNQISVLSQQVSIHSQQISVLSQQVSIISQQVSVLSQSISVLSQQVSILSVRASHPGLGQCRLSVKSTTSLALQPYNGSQIWINGSAFSVPSAGVEIGTAGLTSATDYNVYAFVSATSVVKLEINTTAHATDTTAGNVGVEIKSAASTRSLVGKTRLDASVNFVNSATQRFLINWFNQQLRQGSNAFTANRTTGSASYVELNTEIRIEFLVWPTGAVIVGFSGKSSNGTLNATVDTTVGFDGTTADEDWSGYDAAVANDGEPVAGVQIVETLAEGYHFITLLGRVNAGTGTWVGGATKGLRTALTLGMRG